VWRLSVVHTLFLTAGCGWALPAAGWQRRDLPGRGWDHGCAEAD